MNLHGYDFETMDVNGLYPLGIGLTEEDKEAVKKDLLIHQCNYAIRQYKARIKAAHNSLDTTREHALKIEEYEEKLKWYQNKLKELTNSAL